MKTANHESREGHLLPVRCPLKAGWLAGVALALGLQFATAATTNATPAATPAVQAAAPAEKTLPRSEFDPALPDGRDPFFPRSTRRVAVAAAPTKRSAPDSTQLALKGISGSASRRLALINDITFEQGQEDAVRTSNGRLRIVCEEIRKDSVIVSVGDPPQRLELRLPRPF